MPCPITAANKGVVHEIESRVDKILAAKAAGAPTADLEAEIDQRVYTLYNLTPAEQALIEPHLPTNP